MSNANVDLPSRAQPVQLRGEIESVMREIETLRKENAELKGIGSVVELLRQEVDQCKRQNEILKQRIRLASMRTPTLSVCYSVDVDAASLFWDFDLIVVDSNCREDAVKALATDGRIVFGYLSLGAVDKGRAWYSTLEEKKCLAGENKGYTSVRINLANPAAGKLFLDTVIPEMKQKGFNGLFLDDLDLIYTHNQGKYAVELMGAIREKYPSLKLFANRGLEILGDYAKHIDYVLLESCFALNGTMRDQGDPQWALSHLKKGQKANPGLVGCALDYFADKEEKDRKISTEQADLIEKIKQAHKLHGLVSCVSVKALDVAVRRRWSSTSCQMSGV